MNFNLIATSEILDLGHCNGMTFNTKTNEIVVAYAGDDKKKFVMVDPDTLQIKSTITTEEGNGASGIAYIEDLDIYVCNYGKKIINFYDASFHLIKAVDRDATNLDNYLNQDCGSDGKYVYFEMAYVGTNNILEVFNLDGEYVTTITIPMTMEGESILCVNGIYYLLVYKSCDGALVYQLNYSLKYE